MVTYLGYCLRCERTNVPLEIARAYPLYSSDPLDRVRVCVDCLKDHEEECSTALENYEP